MGGEAAAVDVADPYEGITRLSQVAAIHDFYEVCAWPRVRRRSRDAFVAHGDRGRHSIYYGMDTCRVLYIAHGTCYVLRGTCHMTYHRLHERMWNAWFEDCSECNGTR